MITNLDYIHKQIESLSLKAGENFLFNSEIIGNNHFQQTIDRNIALCTQINSTTNLFSKKLKKVHLLNREFNRSHQFEGSKKLNDLTLGKIKGLVGYHAQLYDKHLEPLRKFIDNYDDGKQFIEQRLKKEQPIKNLIVTAVPREFKAIFSRFKILFSVHSPPFQSDYCFDINKMNELDFILEENQEGYQEYLTENQPKDRPFYILVDGAFEKNNKLTRVNLLLLPNYGGVKAEKVIRILFDESIHAKKIYVVGIAGSLTNKSDISIGDLVISERILSTENLKFLDNGTLQPREVKVNSSNITDEEIQFSKKWIPSLFEPAPTMKADSPLIDETGFKKSVIADYASLNILSKTEKLRDGLNKNPHFKDCKAIEMEAYGICDFYSNSDKNKVKIIKSICDYGDYLKDDSWQNYAADVAASYIEDYLLHFEGIEFTEEELRI
jgi:nucleoside phosphorylase